MFWSVFGGRRTRRLNASSRVRMKEDPVKKVQLITDGACLGNPGRGGWAAILRYGPHKKEIYRLRSAYDEQPHGAHGRY